MGACQRVMLMSIVLWGCGPIGEEGGSASGNRPASENNEASPVKVDRELIAASINKVSCPKEKFILFRNGKPVAESKASDCMYRDGSSAIDVNCSATDETYTPLFMINGKGRTEFANEEIIDAEFTISDWSALGLSPEEIKGCESKVKVGGGEFGNATYAVLKTEGQIKRGSGQYLFGFVLGSLCDAIRTNTSDEIVACFSKN